MNKQLSDHSSIARAAFFPMSSLLNGSQTVGKRERESELRADEKDHVCKKPARKTISSDETTLQEKYKAIIDPSPASRGCFYQHCE